MYKLVHINEQSPLDVKDNIIIRLLQLTNTNKAFFQAKNRTLVWLHIFQCIICAEMN